MDYQVVLMQGKNDRFVIVDKNSCVVNDAQGYGYKTKQNAIKAMWYQFGGGKQKIDTIQTEAKKFWKNHQNISKDIRELSEISFKEISRGEITDKDIVQYIREKFSINIPEKYLNYL